MRKITTLTLLMTSILFSTMSFAFADSVQEKFEFASSPEETLGHFWALEQNLDDKNTELALIYDGVDVDYAGECKDLPIHAGQ